MNCELVSTMINNISPTNFIEILRKQESDIIPITCNDDDGNNTLHHAVKLKHYGLVEEILVYAKKYFPDCDIVNSQNRDGDTPLHIAVSCYGDVANKIADMLLYHGAKENIPNNINIVIKMTRSIEKAAEKQVECHDSGIAGSVCYREAPVQSGFTNYIHSLVTHQPVQHRHVSMPKLITLPYNTLTEQFPKEVKINNLYHGDKHEFDFGAMSK